ncbi:MAG: hypothetical protein ACHP9Y_04410 [Gammaproteobacteria bacterium]
MFSQLYKNFFPGPVKSDSNSELQTYQSRQLDFEGLMELAKIRPMDLLKQEEQAFDALSPGHLILLSQCLDKTIEKCDPKGGDKDELAALNHVAYYIFSKGMQGLPEGTIVSRNSNGTITSAYEGLFLKPGASSTSNSISHADDSDDKSMHNPSPMPRASAPQPAPSPSPSVG